MASTINDKIISCFYETSEDCVKVVDTSGMLKSFNANGLKVMEIDNESDVIGKSWLKFWTGDLEAMAKDAFDRALSGEPAMFEGLCPTFKGDMRFWKVSLVPIMSDTGVVDSILVTSKDTTRLVELDARVKQLEAQVASLKN